jgi:hypothetical protein
VTSAAPVFEPHALSAFPLLGEYPGDATPQAPAKA